MFIDVLLTFDLVQRQLAVLKGQAWNVVQCLKHQVCDAVQTYQDIY